MLKVGLIGCGFMGAMHAACYKKIEGVKLAAVADARKECAEQIAAGTDARIFADGNDLLENSDADIIDICLPTFMHAEYAIKAMDKVRYLFVEKPVALTAEEGRAMIEKSKMTGCRVQVGQVIRFWDEYVYLKNVIEQGLYGKVVNANFKRISPRPVWGWQNWLLDYRLSGGAGQDLHIHDIDYILSLFGNTNKFYSVKNTLGEKNSYVNTLMEYDDFAVSAEGGWGLPNSYPFKATFRVVFENAVIENAEKGFMIYDKDGGRKIQMQKAPCGQSDSELTGGGNISDLGGYYNELLYFCRMAAENRIPDRATLEDSVKSLEFVLKEINFDINK